MKLLSTSVSNKSLKGSSLILYGTCIEAEAPMFLEKLSENRLSLDICLEEEHMNKAGIKLATILRISKPSELIVLTMDGSPHCLALHQSAEQAKNITGSEVNILHFVIEHGEIIEISQEAVKASRHLSQVQRMIKSK